MILESCNTSPYILYLFFIYSSCSFSISENESEVSGDKAIFPLNPSLLHNKMFSSLVVFALIKLSPVCCCFFMFCFLFSAPECDSHERKVLGSQR